MALLTSFAVGLIFGVGLIVSGMANPGKVLGFLDLAGAWDPSLAVVMVGAIAVGVVGFAAAGRRKRSWLGLPMRLPSNRGVDRRLVGGGLLFGIGWGLAGLCPGPALVTLGAGYWQGVIFLGAMLAGMAIHEVIEESVRSKEVGVASGPPPRCEVHRLTEDFFVTAQPSKAELRSYAEQGFRTLINNRPDGEAPGQLSAAEARSEADRLGLTYVHRPVVASAITASDVEAFAQALKNCPRPVLAHCRTGLRSYLLWGAAEVLTGKRDVVDIQRQAAATGFDLNSLATLVARLRR